MISCFSTRPSDLIWSIVFKLGFHTWPRICGLSYSQKLTILERSKIRGDLIEHKILTGKDEVCKERERLCGKCIIVINNFLMKFCRKYFLWAALVPFHFVGRSHRESIWPQLGMDVKLQYFKFVNYHFSFI